MAGGELLLCCLLSCFVLVLAHALVLRSHPITDGWVQRVSPAWDGVEVEPASRRLTGCCSLSSSCGGAYPFAVP
jgi:hypothetical protein